MITSVKVPSKTGEIADVALGFDSIDGELGCCIFRLGVIHKWRQSEILPFQKLIDVCG